MTTDHELLLDLQERLKGLEHQAELIKTVLIVKEPDTTHAAQAYEGLRKQLVAAAAERRSHLNQLVSMAVAVSRATDVDDLRALVTEWMQQAGVVQVVDVPEGHEARDLYDDLAGEGLDGAIEILEPAYVDAETNSLLRTGRARKATTQPAGAAPAAPAAPAAATAAPTDQPGRGEGAPR